MSKRKQVVADALSFGVPYAAIKWELKESSVERYVRCAKSELKPKEEPVKEVVGVIGDSHIPFDHPRYPQFCKETFDAHGVTKVVHIGDLVDNHAISRHVSEPDALGAMEEYERSLERIATYVELFPRLTLCLGNHCSIPARQARELGIPAVYIRSFHSTWNLPSTWEVTEQKIIDDVLYKHGIGSSGQTGAIRSAIRNRRSVVQGHTHSFAGVIYNANSDSLIFGMNVGCGIDVNAYSFRYGRFIENKPIISCGIVKSSTEAYLVPMHME